MGRFGKFRLKSLVVYFAALVGFVLLLEYGARGGYDLYQRFTGRLKSSFTEKDPYTRYRFRPNVRSGRVGETRFNTNRHGFRGEFPRWEHPEGVTRIILTGDSVTFGWTATDDSTTYPAYLQEALTRRWPGRSVAVINAGMPRYHAEDVFGLVVSRLVFMLPKAVVLLVGANDILDSIATPPSLRPKPWQKLLAKSRFFSLLREGRDFLLPESVRERARAEVIRLREKGVDNISPPAFTQYELTLRAIVRVLKDRKIEPVLLTYPLFLREEMTEAEKEQMIPYLVRYPNLSYAGWLRVNRELRERTEHVAREERALLLPGHTLRELRYFSDLFHLNDEGNKALAELVADGLSSRWPGGRVGP